MIRCSRLMLLGTIVYWATLSPLVAQAQLAPSPQSPPATTKSLATVEELVQARLSQLPTYQPRDLLTAGDVEPILKELAKKKWNAKSLDGIRKRLVPDGSVLARSLRTPRGQVLMRQSAQFGNAYDRLDRLSNLSDGQLVLGRLISGPDGYKMIEYMVTTPEGQNMGRMLSADPGAGNFNAPTGRIYTADQLIAELQHIGPNR